MGTPTWPAPVKLFVGLLAADGSILEQAAGRLESAFGQVDMLSDVFAWQTTDYYAAEMGEPLVRRFVTFEKLVGPDSLSRLKLETNALEDAFVRPRGPGSARRLNLDPGYMDAGKLVLASTKAQAHRIYLADGIYAEVTLLYHHGAYHPFVYTYADYRWPQTRAFLRRARRRYLDQRRAVG